jgi:antitoxin (DNA-binding transcriptional repressor) of toxin-antitoxin stability system
MSSREHVNVHAAKTQLSKLLERVERGEEFVIDRAGRPVAMLSRAPVPSEPQREPGALRGRIRMSPDFDDDLPEEVLAAFRGELP